jgi:DNA-binding HxlR family transcriptional regulator
MSADAQPDVLDVRFPTRRILAIIGDKWTTVVLYCLSIREHRRFNELQKQIPDISKKMLIQTLRNLERDGLLERTVYQQVPPKTEYRVERRDVQAGLLSYAEQRALEIGMTIAGGASMILLDEPTAGMSHSETEYAVALIRRVTQRKTLVMVEHDMRVVFDLADTITVLVYGQVVASGPPAEIRANRAVQEAYLGALAA